ncbi:MAG: AURKAIP1/COX24 domain-containing protein [Chloroflexota bacterium]|nr:AURKAIP1/COX24 domain-containing protein [Chloroflexota bacterium]
MGSVLKWRKKKISKHHHKKLLKRTRWQRKYS